MESTCTTLIERVIDGGDSIAWSTFYELYSGLIYRYARGRGLNDTDASDVVADCMASLSKRMSEFRYEPERCRFRSYLRAMVTKRVAQLFRKKQPDYVESMELLGAESDDIAPDQLWEKEWELSHMMYCWSLLEKEVSAVHAEAFRLAVIKGEPTAEVAKNLGITTNHLYQIKARMTRRLRIIMEELYMDD